ncbi:hypothetical protein BDP27DRAFT_221108 [Rhodocollybia butyracea]|uniref:Uncharacterized protein n=1 Tax=Rhodocollybia butyracea TaxID=206335 RepID=A0A9P5UCI0_9AGAR|nr:hypothetical protein BDP27DRAFT_221108 [Rhodocollybia butyracea]
MHASRMTSTSTTLYQLVTYLTRPLINVYPPQTVLQLQIFLHANLASRFLAEACLSPFTLPLSSQSLPPTPIYAACLQSGVAWPEWIGAFKLGGKTLYICVMENNIKVRVGESGDAVAVWNDEPVDIPAISKIKTQNQTQTGSDSRSPMASKLEALLASVRARNSPEEPKQSIVIPSLLATACHSHQSSVDDDDSDSESDTESTTSSFFSETSSTDSMTSVSSTTSSPVQKSSSLTLDAKAPIYVPRMRLMAAESTPAHYLSRSERRLTSATVDKSKADICQYKYQGGQTSVMTGGVMLGSVKPTTAVTPSPCPHIATEGRNVKHVSRSSNNWRTRV